MNEPKTMEEFFEQRKGNFTFVEAYEYNQKLKKDFENAVSTNADAEEHVIHVRE